MLYQKDTYATFTAALFMITTIWNHPKCPPSDERMQEMWHMYVMKYSSAIKKIENLPSAAKWMQLEDIMLNETSWKQKGSCFVFFIWVN